MFKLKKFKFLSAIFVVGLYNNCSAQTADAFKEFSQDTNREILEKIFTKDFGPTPVTTDENRAYFKKIADLITERNKLFRSSKTISKDKAYVDEIIVNSLKAIPAENLGGAITELDIQPIEDRKELAQLLIKAGARTSNLPEGTLDKAIIEAIKRSNPEWLELILSLGYADTPAYPIAAHDLITVLDLAKAYPEGARKVAELFIKKGVNVAGSSPVTIKNVKRDIVPVKYLESKYGPDVSELSDMQNLLKKEARSQGYKGK